MVNSLPKAIMDCKGAESDIKNLIKAIESLNNPLSFVFHVGKDLIVNGKNIYNQTMDLIT